MHAVHCEVVCVSDFFVLVFAITKYKSHWPAVAENSSSMSALLMTPALESRSTADDKFCLTSSNIETRSNNQWTFEELVPFRNSIDVETEKSPSSFRRWEKNVHIICRSITVCVSYIIIFPCCSVIDFERDWKPWQRRAEQLMQDIIKVLFWLT